MALDPRFIGCIRIQPALNDAECDFLLGVLDSDGTLRGTPTGRGDRDVPFARLAWEPCRQGCCLQWNPYLEDPRWMVESLRFVVERTTRLVTATDNDVTGSELPTPCEEVTAASQPARSHGGRFDNVIELRPRRA